MKTLSLALAALALAAAAAWVLTAPLRLPAGALDGLAGDARRGAAVFAAAGCASCHMAPGAVGDARLVLAGGQRFPSAFGTFVAPNISSDPVQGIGGWSLADLGNAVLRGVSPGGQHYYPAFPYASYSRMVPGDLADLKAYLDTLPADASPSLPHEVDFPFDIRRSLGGWKRLFLRDGWVVEGDLTETQQRGRYIVEALAHCGECHTPRNALGGMQTGNWLAGAPDPSGKGRVPDITPGGLTWSEAEIAEYLTSGFTPEYDSVGGLMAHVVENMGQLPESDRTAVAAYLKLVPSRP
ncbi:cytochrome c [Paracoccaceae bacterium Fryx2]|nr:cytochrome c [Paracoccaceae bacterium Fryx2]